METKAGIVTFKLTDGDFLRSIENAVQVRPSRPAPPAATTAAPQRRRSPAA